MELAMQFTPANIILLVGFAIMVFGVGLNELLGGVKSLKAMNLKQTLFLILVVQGGSFFLLGIILSSFGILVTE